MVQRTTKRQVNRLPPERRISDIMTAAREVFTEKGYAESLISDIAERAGVVEGTIYRFFANKRELLQRVAEDWFVEMMASDDEAFGSVRGEWNQIRFIVHHHLNSIRRDAALSRLVFQELRPDPNYRETELFKLKRAYTQRIVEVVRAGIASGAFRPDASPSLVRDMLYGSIEHLTWAYLRNERDFDLDSTADSITDMIYLGLLHQRPTPPSRDLDTLARLEAVADRLERATAQTDTAIRS
ncbi:MAG: TetR/AcrR family transcriptional regulator [Gemmobacter sp.]|nr:TetR/AcrR family transcriptional regulator [Gemmobacter sp.]